MINLQHLHLINLTLKSNFVPYLLGFVDSLCYMDMHTQLEPSLKTQSFTNVKLVTLNLSSKNEWCNFLGHEKVLFARRLENRNPKCFILKSCYSESKSSANSFSTIIVIFVFSKDLSCIPSSKARFCSASMY